MGTFVYKEDTSNEMNFLFPGKISFKRFSRSILCFKWNFENDPNNEDNSFVTHLDNRYFGQFTIDTMGLRGESFLWILGWP